MTLAAFTESIVEDATLAWLESLGHAVVHDSITAAGALLVQAAPRIVWRVT